MKVGVERALQELGRQFFAFDYDPPTPEAWEKDEVFVEKCALALKKKSYELAFSINFHPLLSDLCEELGLPYVSWIYDSPLHIRNLHSMKNSCNRIFHFDRGEVEALAKQGIKAEHLPLAGFPGMCRGTCETKYPVSMVGRLYQNEFAKYMAPLKDYKKGWCEGVLAAQMKVSAGYLIPDLITDEFLSLVNDDFKEALGWKDGINQRQLAYLLAREATARERYLALALLSKELEVHVFGGETDPNLPSVQFHPAVPYDKEMPSVFASSKINLNITLKCIRTGLPLRIFDIISCRGLCLTNWQEEVAECFTPGEEIIVYQELEEIRELAAFFVQHDTERRRIAENGYERLRREHTIPARLEKIL